MFFIPIPIFINFNSYGISGKVKSGDKYTTEWWQNQIGHNFSKQRTASYLNILAAQNRVKKVYRSEYEVVKFEPAKNIEEEEIIEEILKRNKGMV